MIVVDKNIIAYLLLRGDRSKSVDRLYQSDSHWIAPRLWIDEFLNVLATYERLGKLAADETNPILNDALSLMDGRTYEIPPDRVLSVARRTSCSAYDSQYIAPAEDRGLKLYTCDQMVLEEFEEPLEEVLGRDHRAGIQTTDVGGGQSMTWRRRCADPTSGGVAEPGKTQGRSGPLNASASSYSTLHPWSS